MGDEQIGRFDTGSRLLIGLTVTGALLLYIMIVPDPLWTPILLLFGAGILRIYVSTKKVPIDVEISESEKRDLIYYAMLGLVALLIGGNLVKGLYDPPIPQAVASLLSFLALASVFFSVLMAISEEVYFRGELYNLFTAQFGRAFATGTTTALFGVYHLQRYGTDLGDLAYVLVGGLVLAWVTSKTRRVLTAMIAHSLNNLLGTAFLVPALLLLLVLLFVKYRRGKLTWTM